MAWAGGELVLERRRFQNQGPATGGLLRFFGYWWPAWRCFVRGVLWNLARVLGRLSYCGTWVPFYFLFWTTGKLVRALVFDLTPVAFHRLSLTS